MTIKRFLLFLFLNFSALAAGSYFTGKGVPSDWYQQLHKAPWTPPGWVFGAAWSFIMLCFSFFMTDVWTVKQLRSILLTLYALQWILNVSWNPVFFHFHLTVAGLVIISLLLLVTLGLFVTTFRSKPRASLLVLPYIIWLMIATSLNGYIVWNN